MGATRRQGLSARLPMSVPSWSSSGSRVRAARRRSPQCNAECRLSFMIHMAAVSFLMGREASSLESFRKKAREAQTFTVEMLGR